MLKQNQRAYAPPEVRTLKVMVEDGYALSSHGANPSTYPGIAGGIESLSEYGNGFDGSNFN